MIVRLVNNEAGDDCKGLPTLRLVAKGLKAWAIRRSVFRYMGHEA
jgi:hypothetical protein